MFFWSLTSVPDLSHRACFSARNRPHEPRRTTGLWWVLIALMLAMPHDAAADRSPDKNGRSQTGVASVPGVPGVTVDWQRGVIEASASAAADLYAASADVARLKAERLARSRAEERLRRALTALRGDSRLVARVGPTPASALDIHSAQVRFIEYGSNGSVVLRLSLPLTAPQTAGPHAAGTPAGASSVDAGAGQDAGAAASDRSEN